MTEGFSGRATGNNSPLSSLRPESSRLSILFYYYCEKLKFRSISFYFITYLYLIYLFTQLPASSTFLPKNTKVQGCHSCHVVGGGMVVAITKRFTLITEFALRCFFSFIFFHLAKSTSGYASWIAFRMPYLADREWRLGSRLAYQFSGSSGSKPCFRAHSSKYARQLF